MDGDTELDPCPACGHPVSDKAASCPECGHPIAALPASSATTALVLGIAGLIPVWGLLFAPFAWWIGRGAVKGIDAGQFQPGGRRKARAGKVLGIIGIVLWTLTLVLAGIGMAVDSGDAVIFDEDFSSGTEVFSTDSDPAVDLVVEDGKYVVKIKDASTPQSMRHLFGRSYDGVRFEASIAVQADATSRHLSSVSCWARDSGYIFFLNSSGGVGLVESVSESTGQRRPLTGLIATGAIAAGDGSNRLRIDCVGGGTEPTVITGWLNDEVVASVAASDGYDSFSAVGFLLSSGEPSEFLIDNVTAIAARPDSGIQPMNLDSDGIPVPSLSDWVATNTSATVWFEGDRIRFAHSEDWMAVAIDDDLDEGVAVYGIFPAAPLLRDSVTVSVIDGTPVDEGLTNEEAASDLFPGIAEQSGGNVSNVMERTSVGGLPVMTATIEGISGISAADERSARVALIFGESTTYMLVAQYTEAWADEILAGWETVLSTFSEQQ
jgi:hypothetical protein